MVIMEQNNYSTPMLMTQQFRFCPNAFRVDLYKGCSFGCKYCFANSNQSSGHSGEAQTDINIIKRQFEKAYQGKAGLNQELIRERVPMHCGGMSDPFQEREWKYKLTYQLIELSNKYNYPIQFSTKTDFLPEEYFEILDPNIHAFQVSIMGWDDDYISKYETNTPTAKSRLEFVKLLRDKGFWCAIRIQPVVDIEQVLKLVTHAGSIPSYITVEHLKIPQDNTQVKKLFQTEYQKGRFHKSPLNMRNIEYYTSDKVDNIERIKKITKLNGVPVGVGDNDLHHMSDSRCCCGIDTINVNFDHYLKYNLTYFITGNTEINTLWRPNSNVREVFNSRVDRGKREIDFTQKVNEYVCKHSELMYNNECSKNVLRQLNIPIKNKLF